MNTKARVATVALVAKGRTPEDLLRLFQPQRTQDDCLPAALKSVVAEYADRQPAKKRLRLSYGKLAKACGYQANMASILDGALIQASLSSHLDGATYACHFDFGPGMNLKQLGALVALETASYPLVGVNGRWFQDAVLRRPAEGPPATWDHAMIVVDVTAQHVAVYDPMQKFLYPKAKPPELLLDVPLVRFQGYWAGAHQPRWTLWLDQTPQRVADRRLHEFETS